MNYSAGVKFFLAMIVLLAGGCLAPAQTNDVDWNAVLDSAQQWAQANLDDDVLRALQNVDREKVVDFLNHFQDYLKGDYVLDLAQLKVAADNILPLLDAHEETQPYAAWLRARLDYFEAAEQMESAAPTPKPEPGEALPPPANPPFTTEQEIWVKKISPRPWPKLAAKTGFNFGTNSAASFGHGRGEIFLTQISCSVVNGGLAGGGKASPGSGLG